MFTWLQSGIKTSTHLRARTKEDYNVSGIQTPTEMQLTATPYWKMAWYSTHVHARGDASSSNVRVGQTNSSRSYSVSKLFHFHLQLVGLDILCSCQTSRENAPLSTFTDANLALVNRMCSRPCRKRKAVTSGTGGWCSIGAQTPAANILYNSQLQAGTSWGYEPKDEHQNVGFTGAFSAEGHALC